MIYTLKPDIEVKYANKELKNMLQQQEDTINQQALEKESFRVLSSN